MSVKREPSVADIDVAALIEFRDAERQVGEVAVRLRNRQADAASEHVRHANPPRSRGRHARPRLATVR